MSQNNPLTALLDARPFILLDGAMATELEARGCNLADSLWSAKVLVDNPELIREVHLDYFRAGAQVAITASYQATPAGFARRRARCWLPVRSGRTAPTWRTARSIAAIISAAMKNFRRFIVRAWKRCSTPGPICWPAKPYPTSPRLKRWRSC